MSAHESAHVSGANLWQLQSVTWFFTVSKWTLLKQGLETVVKQLECQKRGHFMGHLWDWDGCKWNKLEIVSHSCFQLGHHLTRCGRSLTQAICGHFWAPEEMLWVVELIAGLTGWMMVVDACGVKGPRAAHTCAHLFVSHQWAVSTLYLPV